MANAYAADGMTSAMAERAMGLDRELTTREANEVERALEDKARYEAETYSRVFEEWLWDREDWKGGPGSECLRLLFAPVLPHSWSARVTIQRASVISDWIAYRVNTFTDDERAEVEREVLGE